MRQAAKIKSLLIDELKQAISSRWRLMNVNGLVANENENENEKTTDQEYEDGDGDGDGGEEEHYVKETPNLAI